jgi:hypothetical protein
VEYLRGSRHRSPRCPNGLVKLDGNGGPVRNQEAPFAEIVFWPGRGRFSGRATWQVLVVGDAAPRAGRPRSDLVVHRRELADLTAWLSTASPGSLSVPGGAEGLPSRAAA